jgi:Ca2+-binding EF-hand superfamily protein
MSTNASRVIYGGLDEVTELQLGIDPAALYDEEAIRLIFDSMDADESGELEPSEVRQLCESLAQRLLSQAELASALASMDPDGDGTVVFDEFFQWWKSAVGDPGGMFSSLFAMGCKVEKANLCLPSGGQAIFTPRCWVDVQSSAEGTDAVAAVEAENEEQEEPIRDKDKLKAKAREAVAVSGMRPFPVTRRLKPPPAVDPSAAPKPGARRGAKNWPGLGDVVELAPDAKAEGKSGEARCLAAGGAIGQVVAEATGKGGARRFRVAADSDGSESWYELVELAPHKTEQQGYVAKGSLMEQRKGAEAHVLSLGLVGVASWPLHLLYGKEDEGGEEMLLRLGRHGILTTAQLRNAITAIPWAVQGLTDDEIQGVAGNASLNYPFEAYYSGKVPAVSVGKKGKPPAQGVVARPCVLNHRLLVGTSSAKKQKDKGQKSSSAKRQWITTPLMDVILDAIGPDPLAEFAGGLGDTTVIPGRFLHAVALRSIPPPRSPSAVAQAPPVSAPILTALLSADLLHLRPQLRAFGLCDPVSLLPTLEGVAEMSEGQLMNVPLNKLLRDLRESSGVNTLRPISIPTLRILAGRVAGRQAGLDLTELDGCRLTGRRGTEWDAVPQNLSHKTLDLLASGQLSDAGKGDGQPGDVVYIEGNMPLLLVVPYGGMDAQGGKGGGGSVWWNDWAVPHSQGGGGGGGGKKCLGAIGAVNLARAVHAAIGEMCGSTPHVIVNQLRAHWCMTTSPRADGIDGTGDIPEGTRAKRSGAAWDNYHTFIEVAKGRMQRLHSSLLKKGVGGAVSPGDTPSLVLELEWSGDASDGGAAADPWLIGLGLTGRPLRTAVSAGSGRASTGGGAGGAAGRQQILRVFKRFDADGSGSIDGSELRAAAGELGIELCEQDTADIMQELDADGSGQIELQEFEDWFSGLLGGAGGGGGQLEQLQVRAVLATSSVWGVAQRQQQPLPGTNVTGSPRQSISGMSSLGAHLSAVGIGCTPSPDMPEARQSSGVPMQLPKVSFSLLSHGSASEGGILSTDAMAIYAPAAECAAEAVDGEGGWGERLGMGLLTYLAAQYSWQATPCLAPR